MVFHIAASLAETAPVKHLRFMSNSFRISLVAAAVVAAAPRPQTPASEFVARRDSLAARIDSGIVVAFGGRTLVNDFGTFFQLPAFHYLTNYDEPDAAFVMTVRHGVGNSTLFITPADPRRAFYYGWRPDSAEVKRVHGVSARSFSALNAALDSLANTGLPIYTLDDFEDADFARADSLTRGKVAARSLRAKYPSLRIADAHPIVDSLRARKSPAEIALLKKAAE